MIRVSFVVLFLDLQYHEMNLASGAQTIRLGWAGPVSYLHGRATLTGCFLFTIGQQNLWVINGSGRCPRL